VAYDFGPPYTRQQLAYTTQMSSIHHKCVLQYFHEGSAIIAAGYMALFMFSVKLHLRDKVTKRQKDLCPKTQKYLSLC